MKMKNILAGILLAAALWFIVEAADLISNKFTYRGRMENCIATVATYYVEIGHPDRVRKFCFKTVKP